MAYKLDRDSILQQIASSMENMDNFSNRRLGASWERGRDINNAAFSEQSKIARLKELLSLTDQGNQGGAGSFTNPFGNALMGSEGYSGAAPQVSTDNRFAAGLTDAESRLRALLDDPNSVKNTASYNFRLKQGEDALQRQMGAKGMLNSGNRLMELTKYGQDMASQEYDNQFGRLGNILGNYSTGYVADKNANTNLFGAQATAWNQAQSNADRNNLGWAQLQWDQNKPRGGGSVIRTSLQRSPIGTPMDNSTYMWS